MYFFKISLKESLSSAAVHAIPHLKSLFVSTVLFDIGLFQYANLQLFRLIFSSWHSSSLQIFSVI